MTQTERLFARIKKMCKENPGSLLGITIITDKDGEPFMWIPTQCLDVEGNDESLVAGGIKPTTRKLPASP